MSRKINLKSQDMARKENRFSLSKLSLLDVWINSDPIKHSWIDILPHLITVGDSSTALLP
jgi:hypothetical protein